MARRSKKSGLFDDLADSGIIATNNRYALFPGRSRRNTAKAQSLDHPDWPYY